MTNLYAKALPVPKSKPLPSKCSTCADRTCRQRGRVCDWRHCKDWKEGPRLKTCSEGKLPTDYEFGGYHEPSQSDSDRF